MSVLACYVEAKDNLADFEQAFKDGYITEDRLEGIKADLEIIENNYNRLTYIMVLLNKPNRKAKHGRYNKSNAKIIDALADRNATMEDVELENADALAHLKAELKQLTNSAGK